MCDLLELGSISTLLLLVLGIVLTSGISELFGIVVDSITGSELLLVCVVVSEVSLSILRPHPVNTHADKSKLNIVTANLFIISLLILIAIVLWLEHKVLSWKFRPKTIFNRCILFQQRV